MSLLGFPGRVSVYDVALRLFSVAQRVHGFNEQMYIDRCTLLAKIFLSSFRFYAKESVAIN